VDAQTGQIVASALTNHNKDDAAQVKPLLDQVAGPIASFTGDGAYDREGVYADMAERPSRTGRHRAPTLDHNAAQDGRERPYAAIPTATRLEP